MISANRSGMVTLLALLTGTATVWAQGYKSAPTFFYDASGKRAYVHAPDEFVVLLRDQAQRPNPIRSDVLPPVVAAGSEAAQKLERSIARRGLHVVRGITQRQAELLPDVDFALPLLYLTHSDSPIYPSQRIVARFKAGITQQQVRQLADSLGCDVEAAPGGMNRYIFTVRNVKQDHPVAIANQLHERADTFYAEPDFFLPKVGYAPPVIDDPFYLSLQWHLDGDSSKGAAAGTDINVEAAWDTNNGPAAEGSATVRVAILDECVEKLHEDLFPNFWAGLDVDQIPFDDDPSPDAGQRHGTACAGLAVAKGNSLGVRGVAPNCGLIGVKFFGGSISDMATGFLFTVDPDGNGDHSDGASVLSNSWGFADGTLLPSDVVNAINFAAQSGRDGKGCLVLFAAANNDHTVNGVSALAQLSTTMAVGGTNSNGEHTEFSDVGPEIGITTPTNDRGDDGVRLPWLDITTTDNMGSSGYNGIVENLNYTDEFGGTSAATPIAAGVLALIISQDETMTAAQARAIMQHTAVRVDEPYGRFDGITGHSHRLGFGRADVGAAVVAAVSGMRWPDRIRTLTASPTGSDILLTWNTPLDSYAGSLLVRSSAPFAWMPTDGLVYTVGQEVQPGVTVFHNDGPGTFTDVGASTGGFFYGAYPYSSANLYGFGAKTHLIRNGVTLLYDNLEGPDPGWSHGGAGDEWQRGLPTSANSIFGQVVGGSGPLAGLRGTRGINGDNCWGTDLSSIYAPDADAYLDTPLVNLTGISAPVFLEYHDWCLLETFYDTCTVEAVDVDGNFLGFIDDDTGGDYDWTQQVYDISAFAGQAIKVRFRIASDGQLQRDGWFLDEIRITVADNIPLPPLANDVYLETTENTAANVILGGSDPNPGTDLDFVITQLPAHGDLLDPNGGLIASVPYTLLNNGNVVTFDPDLDYQGPDQFTYHTNDGALDSNQATVDLSIGTPLPAYAFALDIDPGWLMEGGWEFGVPQGLDGDPLAGFTGSNVYGYNLAGGYPSDLPAEHLTSLPFNCTGLSRVEVRFARWLGIEAGNFDNASIEATNDGANWQTVWRHTGGDMQETQWSQQIHNIADLADDRPFVQVRWTMGPTDGNTEFSGWNLDDIQLTGIGTPPANQPPLALTVNAATAQVIPVDVTLSASDANDDSLDYTIESLPSDGTIADPNGSDILSAPYTLLAGGNLVTYTPDGSFAGFDNFTYSANDGLLDSNLAPVSVHVIAAAVFPYQDDFEAGDPLAIVWFAESTNVGRIRVTDQGGPIGQYHVTMDSGAEQTFSLNELTLAIDLVGASNVLFEYSYKAFGEEIQLLPDSWTGSVQGDGIAISEDGQTWYRLADFQDLPDYQTVLIDLDAAAADAGISYSNTFRIRFQQYDNFPLETDGIAIDNVRVLQGTQDPLITTNSLPTAVIDQAYGPLAMTAVGGDPPLVWSAPAFYTEAPQGANPFATVGIAQGFTGDSGAGSVYEVPLPFSFLFYGASYNTVRIGVDGFLDFAPFLGSTWNNSELLLSANIRIAALWDDLIVDPGDDIYIDDTVPGQFTVRWAVTHKISASPCNFSATLFDDGRVRLDYGSGNGGLTPTVGVSSGDTIDYLLSTHDGAADLADAESVEFDFTKLPPGLAISTNGIVSGTPFAAGDYQAMVMIQDDSGRTDSKMFQVTSIAPVWGDFNSDGKTDLDDYADFYLCIEMIEPSAACLQVFDDNGNLLIDLQDYAKFQISLSQVPP